MITAVDARVPTQRTQMQSYTYPPRTMPQVTLGYGSDETTPVVQEYTRKATGESLPVGHGCSGVNLGYTLAVGPARYGNCVSPKTSEIAFGD